MSKSSRGGETVNGSSFHPRASSLQNNESIAEPLEEPYLEPSYLNKPILDLYDPETEDARVLLEEPDSSFAWIRARKQDLVDVEGYR